MTEQEIKFGNIQTDHGKCIECKFWTQTKNCPVCGHPDANKQGNGRYVYYDHRCDINKFEKR